MESVLPRVVELCREDVLSTRPRGDPIERLIDLVEPVRYEGKEVAQSMERMEKKCALRYTRITATNRSVEEVYELGFEALDADSVGFNVSGKELSIVLSTKYKDAVIKYYKDGEAKSYQSRLELVAEDVEQARAMIEAVKAAIAACP